MDNLGNFYNSDSNNKENVTSKDYSNVTYHCHHEKLVRNKHLLLDACDPAQIPWVQNSLDRKETNLKTHPTQTTHMPECRGVWIIKWGEKRNFYDTSQP